MIEKSTTILIAETMGYAKIKIPRMRLMTPVLVLKIYADMAIYITKTWRKKELLLIPVFFFERPHKHYLILSDFNCPCLSGPGKDKISLGIIIPKDQFIFIDIEPGGLLQE